jgi:hypothetical protein
MPATLSYETLTPASTRSRWGLAAMFSAVAGNLLFAWDIVYARYIVEPAYRAVGAAAGGPLALQHAAYDHYGDLKIVAVTLLILSLILLATALFTAIVALGQRRQRKLPAIVAIILLVSQLLMMSVLR